MRRPGFTCFGYGSLVNRRTLPAESVFRPARLAGWRRAWRLAGDSTFGKRCTLTVVPDAGASILGVMVSQPVRHRDTMSKREAHYDPVTLGANDVEWLGDPDPEDETDWADAFVHVGKPEFMKPGDADHPVMLSYVDVVIAGFREQFGDDGAAHFIETTLDWHVPVLDDRRAPRYPRVVPVSDADRRFVDQILAQIPATMIDG